MSFTTHIDKAKRHISISNRSNTIIKTYLTAEKIHSYLFVNGAVQKLINLKQKILEL